MKHISIICLLLAALTLNGCGGKTIPDGFPKNLVPVSITLLKGGAPVADVNILLVSETAGAVRMLARTDSSGTAKLETGINAYTKAGVPAGPYKMLVLVEITPTLQDLTPDESSKLSEQQIAAHQEKKDKETADLRRSHAVPVDWEDGAKTPVKLTVPSGGKAFTIDIADEKTFVQ